MIPALILGSLVVVVCIAAGEMLQRFGVPALVMFLVLGLLAGSVGPWGPITFEDYHIAEMICSIALVFIIFYGGFGTNWKTAKPVVAESVLFSTLGVLITAGVVTLFAHFVFSLSWAESFLIGSVVSCIDAASIFSILRNRKLSLKYNTASVLEIEGGCNDLPAYMLTIVAIIILQGESADLVAINVVLQLVVGVFVGTIIALVIVWVLGRIGSSLPEGMGLLVVLAVAVLSYAFSTYLGGNGYLSCYLCGIILGNSAIPKKHNIVLLFDSIDWLAQIMIFFLMGLMATPERLPAMILPALGLTAFLLFIGRPAAVFAIFPWFKPEGIRNNWRKGLFISWAGIRGAASIVFVFMALAAGVVLQFDLFSLIFMVALYSILLQGSLFVIAAKKLNMIDSEGNYLMSFNDFREQSPQSFFRIRVEEDDSWAHKAIRDIQMGPNLLIVMIRRGDESLAPRGSTVIEPGDVLVLTGESYCEDTSTEITQITVDAANPWSNRQIKDLDMPEKALIVSIVRNNQAITPKGDITILPGDVLTLFGWH
ncbi:MAG: potassium/proton antiporter [Coriobacteriales bacterium]|jgi:cell volume regulation protein A|nr:potassium/proton antiporter [Coriobacteriales bacterium]